MSRSIEPSEESPAELTSKRGRVSKLLAHVPLVLLRGKGLRGKAVLRMAPALLQVMPRGMKIEARSHIQSIKVPLKASQSESAEALQDGPLSCSRTSPRVSLPMQT